MQLTVTAQSDVNAVVSSAPQAAVVTTGLPLVAQTLTTRLIGSVSYSSSVALTSNTTYTYTWRNVGNVSRRAKLAGKAHSRLLRLRGLAINVFFRRKHGERLRPGMPTGTTGLVQSGSGPGGRLQL